MQKVNIFWYRRDLRVEDNAGLFYALSSEYPVLPIFIFDKNILDKLSSKSDARVMFIHDQIRLLNDEFSKYESNIKTFYSSPIEAFETLIKSYDIHSVYTNRDYEPYAKKRDFEVEGYLKKSNINLLTFKDQVIFEQKEIINGQGEPYKVFTPYKNAWIQKFEKLKLESFDCDSKFDRLFKINREELIPLNIMGFERSDIEIPKSSLAKKIVENYASNRNFPGLDGTTKIGIHLRFGTISVRQKVRFGHKHSSEWLNELIWREFYMMVLSNFPDVVNHAFKKKYQNIPWENNEIHFKAWCDGLTGYPLVDAGMRELNATGFMHNRVRMVVASFLTKHLLIDWRWGEAYFAEKLLDFELSSNNGGWQWAAGTGTDAQPYFRVFNPQSQLEKFDKDLRYVRKWVPEFGSDKYPQPIVDHKEARLKAIKTYKEAIS